MNLSRNKSKKKRRGQSLLEYILLMAGLSALSVGFVKFFSTNLLYPGLSGLSGPEGKASICMSHKNPSGGETCE
jgi:hypothetical protein